MRKGQQGNSVTGPTGLQNQLVPTESQLELQIPHKQMQLKLIHLLKMNIITLLSSLKTQQIIRIRTLEIDSTDQRLAWRSVQLIH